MWVFLFWCVCMMARVCLHYFLLASKQSQMIKAFRRIPSEFIHFFPVLYHGFDFLFHKDPTWPLNEFRFHRYKSNLSILWNFWFSCLFKLEKVSNFWQRQLKKKMFGFHSYFLIAMKYNEAKYLTEKILKTHFCVLFPPYIQK